MSALSAAAPGWRVPAIRVVSHSTFQHIILTAIVQGMRLLMAEPLVSMVMMDPADWRYLTELSDR